MRQILIALTFLLLTNQNTIAQKQIRQFIFFELERERIHDTSFLHNDGAVGAQLKYIWRELEPKKNNIIWI